MSYERHIASRVLPWGLGLAFVLAGCGAETPAERAAVEDHPEIVDLDERLAEAEVQATEARARLVELEKARTAARERILAIKLADHDKRAVARDQAGASPAAPAERACWQQQLNEALVRISVETESELNRANGALADLASQTDEAKRAILLPEELRREARRVRWSVVAGMWSAGRQLDRRVEAIRFDKQSLYEALTVFREEHGVNLYVNWAALKAAGIRADRNVSYAGENVRIREALQAVLDQVPGKEHWPALGEQDNVVVVSTPPGLARSAAADQRFAALAVAPKAAEYLRSRMERLYFIEIELVDVLDFFATYLETDESVLIVPWEKLEASGIHKETMIDLDLRNVRIGRALRLTLDLAETPRASLDVVAQDGKLAIEAVGRE